MQHNATRCTCNNMFGTHSIWLLLAAAVVARTPVSRSPHLLGIGLIGPISAHVVGLSSGLWGTTMADALLNKHCCYFNQGGNAGIVWCQQPSLLSRSGFLLA